jgi:tripartite-type tricarboxylate transporter receptor subunit TctC
MANATGHDLHGLPGGLGCRRGRRLLQPSLEKTLGQRIVIDYKSGAGGNLASEAVANAKPDGYTFLMGTAATHGVNAALYKKLPFDVEADFTPITTIVDVPNVLAINPAVIDAKVVPDFIAKVKAAPGKYSFGSTGNGTGTHLAFAAFNSRPGSTWCTCPTRAARRHQLADQGRDLLQLPAAAGHAATRQVRQGAPARRHHGQARRHRARPADHRRTGPAGLRELHLVRHPGTQGPRPGDRGEDERGPQGGDRGPRDPAKLIELGNTPRYETLAQFKATVHADRAKWAKVVQEAGATID